MPKKRKAPPSRQAKPGAAARFDCVHCETVFESEEKYITHLDDNGLGDVVGAVFGRAWEFLGLPEAMVRNERVLKSGRFVREEDDLVRRDWINEIQCNRVAMSHPFLTSRVETIRHAAHQPSPPPARVGRMLPSEHQRMGALRRYTLLAETLELAWSAPLPQSLFSTGAASPQQPAAKRVRRAAAQDDADLIAQMHSLLQS
eukprot:Rhum_TRINITY_DN8975_c0_g1::Rhum_TRINITY_DN8975_c0_g1_i1::g.30883::m.30883